MKRDQLEHVIRAAADITDDEIVVVGSQAVLGQFPNAPEALLVSLEADIYPRNDPRRADEIDGAMGDGSPFHETFGYYAHGVGPETPTAPSGWEERLIRIDVPAVGRRRNSATGWCMEIHDLVLAKLAAGRQHDLEFVAEALRAGLAEPGELRLRIDWMPESARAVTRTRLEGVIAKLQRHG